MARRTPEEIDAWLWGQLPETELLAFYRWITQCSLREYRDVLRASVETDGDLYAADEQQFMLRMADELDVDKPGAEHGSLRYLPLVLPSRRED